MSSGLDPLSWLHLDAAVGSRTTKDALAHLESKVRWESAALDAALGLHWYASGTYERDHGDLEDVREAFAGLSYRF